MRSRQVVLFALQIGNRQRVRLEPRLIKSSVIVLSSADSFTSGISSGLRLRLSRTARRRIMAKSQRGVAPVPRQRLEQSSTILTALVFYQVGDEALFRDEENPACRRSQQCRRHAADSRRVRYRDQSRAVTLTIAGSGHTTANSDPNPRRIDAASSRRYRPPARACAASTWYRAIIARTVCSRASSC